MTELTTVELLREARDLIADPEGWTRGALARDRDGRDVDPGEPEACQWCAAGAYNAVVGRDPMRVSPVVLFMAECALGDRVCERGFENVADFNDDPATTHADVLAVYDDAIRAEEAGWA